MKSAKPPLPDLDNLVQMLRGDLLERWTKRAQKQALIEWRDRTEPPGLAARFTEAGAKFYSFGQRSGEYVRRKGGLPDFVKTGSLRDMMKARQPRSSGGGRDVVITRMKYGGGALNFLTDVHGVTSVEVSTTLVKTPIRSYSALRKGMRHTTLIVVKAYTQTRKHVERKVTRSGPSYADEFKRFDQDQPWITRRIDQVFREIVRGATVTKGGRIRSTVYERADHVG